MLPKLLHEEYLGYLGSATRKLQPRHVHECLFLPCHVVIIMTSIQPPLMDHAGLVLSAQQFGVILCAYSLLISQLSSCLKRIGVMN
jgi:hypothetical protein